MDKYTCNNINGQLYGDGYNITTHDGDNSDTPTPAYSKQTEVFDEAAWKMISSELLSDKLNIYPNQAKENINIDIPIDGGTTVQISVTDITGKVVYENMYRDTEQEKFEVNVATLQTGLYLVKVKYGEHNSMSKITVTK